MSNKWSGGAAAILAAVLWSPAFAWSAGDDDSVKACALISAEQVAAVLGVSSVTPGPSESQGTVGTWGCGFYLDGQQVPTRSGNAVGDWDAPVTLTLYEQDFLTKQHENNPDEAAMTMADYYKSYKAMYPEQREEIALIGEDSFFYGYPASACKKMYKGGYSGSESVTFLKGSVMVSVSAPCGPTPLDKDKFVAIGKIIADGLK